MREEKDKLRESFKMKNRLKKGGKTHRENQKNKPALMI